METKTSVIKELDTNQDTRCIKIGVQLCLMTSPLIQDVNVNEKVSQALMNI